MEKLLTHNGGQPVCLDDLEMIQNEIMNMTQRLLSALSGGASVYLLNPLLYEVVNSENAGESVYRVERNVVVYGGNMYAFEPTDINIKEGEKVYVVLSEVDTDFRMFDDGQERPCRRNYIAKLSHTNNGGMPAYDLFAMKSLSDYMYGTDE